MKEMTRWASFHSATSYGSDLLPLQDPNTSLTSPLHTHSEITWILPVPNTSVKTSQLGDSQQFH